MIHPITAEQMQKGYFWAMHCNPALAQAFNPKRAAREFANENEIPLGDFFGPARTRDVSHPRQDFMRILSKEHGMTDSQIGRIFKRDPTTVRHGIRASERRASQ